MIVIENSKINDEALDENYLVDKEFYHSEFYNCKFPDLRGTKFYNCIFNTCDLSNIKLNDSQIRNGVFSHSKLIGIGFSSVNFAFSADFFNCDMRYMEFLELNLKGMKIENCDCQGVRFSDCNLRESKLINTNFNNSIFSKCDLQNANLLNNTSLLINPTGNKVKQTKIDLKTAVNIATLYGFDVNL
jgi:uncharacterized protein YjbI with pentapeptide repeats